jgi:hypothetical protein
MNADTLYYQAVHGKNSEVAGRNYQSVELYALKPLDLVMPPPDHRVAFARKLAWNYLYDDQRKVFSRGEMFYQYVGVFGIAALVGLAFVTVAAVLRGPPKRVPGLALAVLWLLLYSVVGGLNGLLGQAGFALFRCANRYSICILAVALIFAVQRLSRITQRWPSWWRYSGAVAVSLVVLCDQLPPTVTAAALAESERAVASDQTFARAMERALPPRGMVFQLPVMKFPESWPINQMGDYEHFRPYIYSSTLRFSYGNDKGRPEDGWQSDVAKNGPAAMVRILEQAGFSAIYINRRGFADQGAAVLQGYEAAGRAARLESPAGDLVCTILQPEAHPVTPEIPPQFTVGWYAEEGDATNTWRCSSGDAEVRFTNSTDAPRAVTISCELLSYSPRTVAFSIAGTTLYQTGPLTAARLPVRLSFTLPPGSTTLQLKTQPPVTFPGNADTRVLGFVLYNFNTTKTDLEPR